MDQSSTALTMAEEDSASSESNEAFSGIVVYTAAEIRMKGLLLVNFKRRRIRKAKTKRNNRRFKGHFGASPSIVAQIWEDLQLTNVPEDKIPHEMLKLDDFLMALHHLKRYPTDLEREAIFDIDEMQGRDRVWYFVNKIRALAKEKICWPSDNFGDDIWVVTVDGVHFWIEEPQHPTWSQDREYYSHKYGHAGLSYELGISISGNKRPLVWMSGPHPAGRSDNSIFQKEGLMAKLVASGKRVIGDGGYPGHAKAISTPNKHDGKAVKLFKSRALKRHEKFNGMIKHFDCLKGRFRHSVDRFAECMEAVCVICQYKCEMGDQLYNVLVQVVVDAVENEESE